MLIDLMAQPLQGLFFNLYGKIRDKSAFFANCIYKVCEKPNNQ